MFKKSTTTLLQAWKEGKTFFAEVIRMLQTQEMEGLLREDASLGERAGVVSLVLALVEEMERRQRAGVFALAQNPSPRIQRVGKQLTRRM